MVFYVSSYFVTRFCCSIDFFCRYTYIARGKHRLLGRTDKSQWVMPYLYFKPVIHLNSFILYALGLNMKQGRFREVVSVSLSLLECLWYLLNMLSELHEIGPRTHCGKNGGSNKIWSQGLSFGLFLLKHPIKQKKRYELNAVKATCFFAVYVAGRNYNSRTLLSVAVDDQKRPGKLPCGHRECNNVEICDQVEMCASTSQEIRIEI